MYNNGMWRPVLRQSLGPFSSINESLYRMSLADPSSLPNLRIYPRDAQRDGRKRAIKKWKSCWKQTRVLSPHDRFREKITLY